MSSDNVDFVGIRESVNKELKSEIAHLAADPNLASEITGYLPTGWTLLDAALGGGVPLGRIIELYGEESSGKSTLCYQIVRNVQKAGGVAVYLDVESTFPKDLAVSIGVDLDKLILIHEGITLDGKKDVFSYILKFLDVIRSGYPDVPLVFIWDTLATTPCEGDAAEEDGQTSGIYRARIIRDGMRRITLALAKSKASLIVVNHVHEVVDDRARWGGKRYVTGGGMGVKYAASARVLLRTGSLILDESKRALGVEVTAKVEKSKIGIPRGIVKSRLYFGFGYDDRWSVFDFLKDEGVIQQKGAWATIPGPDGVEIKTYPSKLAEALNEHPEVVPHLQKLAGELYLAKTPQYC